MGDSLACRMRHLPGKEMTVVSEIWMNSNLIRHVEINLAYPLSPPKIKTREDLIIKFGYSNIPAIIKKGIVMAYEHIVFEQENGVATVTLNRPDKLNAWTRTMEREVRNAMEEADKDGDIRVIVLTGAGRGFCAGADMDLLSGIEDGSEKREPGAGRRRCALPARHHGDEPGGQPERHAGADRRLDEPAGDRHHRDQRRAQSAEIRRGRSRLPDGSATARRCRQGGTFARSEGARAADRQLEGECSACLT